MPAIVVIAYNRPDSLERLLQSIDRGYFFPKDAPITLHISIDHSNETKVATVAKNFEWKHGEKVISIQSSRLGLLKHVIHCGDLTEKYGEIIVLEDDLVVAPDFYNYADQALSHYRNDSEIAGISLFKYRCEENQFLPFEPLNNGTDVHFIQVASSWGQAWNSSQWKEFKHWLEKKGESKLTNLPNYMQKWGENSWKRYFNSFLLETNRFFVFPSVSLSSNFEDAGTHATSTGLMQVPLLAGSRKYLFANSADARLKYDAYFELLPECVKQLAPELEMFSFDVDLYGAKPKNAKCEYRLTTLKGTDPIRQFGTMMYPLISNVLSNAKGSGIGLFPMNKIEFEQENPSIGIHFAASDVRKIVRHAEELISFSVVIPVVNDQREQLEQTIELIAGCNRKIQLILVISSRLSKDDFDRVSSKIELVQSDGASLESCLLKGFERAQQDIVTWLRPGVILSENAFDASARVFNDFKTIHWILGVKEMEIPMNRWSKKNALEEFERSSKMSTEGTFFRKELLGSVKISDVENMFYFLLRKSNLTVLGKELRKAIPENTSNISKEYAEKWLNHERNLRDGFFYKTLKPIIRRRFFNNGTLFSLIYRRKEQLPFVLRYDQDNNSYYLNEY